MNYKLTCCGDLKCLNKAKSKINSARNPNIIYINDSGIVMPDNMLNSISGI